MLYIIIINYIYLQNISESYSIRIISLSDLINFTICFSLESWSRSTSQRWHLNGRDAFWQMAHFGRRGPFTLGVCASALMVPGLQCVHNPVWRTKKQSLPMERRIVVQTNFSKCVLIPPYHFSWQSSHENKGTCCMFSTSEYCRLLSNDICPQYTRRCVTSKNQLNAMHPMHWWWII